MKKKNNAVMPFFIMVFTACKKQTHCSFIHSFIHSYY